MALVSCSYYYDGLTYCCEIKNQKVAEYPIFFTGVHIQGKFSKSVKKLQIYECDMITLPPKFQELFPALVSLSVTDCTLKSIGREHIGKWKNLREIQINNCKVRSLKGDTFRGLWKLESIEFWGNQLEEIEPDIFDGLEMLTFVDLERNAKIDMQAGKKDIERIKREIALKCKPKNQTDKIEGLELRVLKLSAEVAALKRSLKEKEKERSQASMNLKRIMDVLSDDTFMDFVINVGDSSFGVHKLLFAAHSKTLSELLRNNPEAEELNLFDVTDSTFRVVHSFIYTSQLPADANYLELFAASAQLKIDALKEAAAEHLLANINEKNSFEVLVLSNKFEHEELRQAAFANISTKIIPGRRLSDELAKQPEKLRNFIELKRRMDKELEALESVE